MIKAFMLPTPDEARGDTTNSINAIVLHLQKHLPKYDVELVGNRHEADLVVGNAGMTDGSYVDVAMVHGLYPTAYANITTGWHWAANQHVVANMLGAKAITVPSRWVADILRRDMHVDPHVIGWAIDPNQWQPGNNQGYVLWNKTRVDGVCSPEPLVKLAAMAPDQRFLTTFGTGTPNIQATGRVPFATMQEMIHGAAVYLSTTKETFGLSILESMACGVPILGFREGAIVDIVKHGETGYLVAPGDYAALREGLDYCLKYRDVLGANARAVALTYNWDRVASQFANIYRNALRQHEGPKVSVVVPVYNYEKYVGQTLDSICQQQGVSFEIIVVNDGSTDDSKDVIARALQSNSPERAVTYHIENGGVANARNYGIAHASGQYICCIDADDRLLDPRFLKTLSDALDSDPKLGIAFTGLRVMNEQGQLGNMNAWPNGYSFDLQVQRHNQVPTCCMFRREAWERVGGYRKKYTPAEDAEFFLRIGSLGYTGRQVTTEGWFGYRLHDKSLSGSVRTGEKKEPDWIGDKPWIANGQRPFASDGKTRWSWPVRNYDRPKVSVIIPVAPYHIDVFREAVDSVESQTEPYWECIVVNDSGKELNLMGMPFVKVVDTHGAHHASVARNTGIAAASGHFVTFLDADDVFDPLFLERTLRQYAIYGKYVYTDLWNLNKEGVQEYHKTPEFDPVKVFRQTSLHSINILIPKADLLKVGGFNETYSSWEDTELFMKLAAAGICGVRLGEPLVTYRYTSGRLREHGETIKPDLLKRLRNEFSKEMQAESIMCCGNEDPRPMPMDAVQPSPGEQPTAGLVRILYNGPPGGHEVVGWITKRRYGYRQRGDTFYVAVDDYSAQPDIYVPIAEVNISEPTADPGVPVLIQA